MYVEEDSNASIFYISIMSLFKKNSNSKFKTEISKIKPLDFDLGHFIYA
jgi:hypothetical protein